MADGIQEIDSNLIESNYDNVVYSFDDLNLKKEIVRGMWFQKMNGKRGVYLPFFI